MEGPHAVPGGWLSTGLPWTRARPRAGAGQTLFRRGADWTGAQGGVPHGLNGGLLLLKIFRRVKGEVNSVLIKSVGGRKFGGVAKPSAHREDVGKTQRAVER